MIWHVVRLELGGLEEAIRDELEGLLADLADLDVVSFLRVGRDLTVPGVTGLIVGLADEAALAAYREHPGHQPALRRLAELDVPRVALDIVTGDDPGALA